MMFDIQWWHYIIAGFCLGLYIHNHRTRHWLHWLAIKALRGFIWILQRTDYYYKEPKMPRGKQAKQPPAYGEKKDGVEVEPDELDKWLKKNPEISVSER